MTFRPMLALAAAAALALPAAALAEGGTPSPTSGPATAPCAAPRSEGQTAPCVVRVCAAGQASTPDVPCLAPCAPGVRPTREAPCAPVAGSFAQPKSGDTPPPAPAGQAHQPETPHQGQGQELGRNGKGNAFGFIKNRVWRLSGEADGFDTDRHALRLVVDQVTGIAPRLAARLEEALGDQADVLVGPQTRVLDADGHRLTGDAAAKALDDADTVKVTGKLAPPRVWVADQDGTPVPAVRALRVKISS